jgi:hypothetical protein
MYFRLLLTVSKVICWGLDTGIRKPPEVGFYIRLHVHTGSVADIKFQYTKFHRHSFINPEDRW